MTVPGVFKQASGVEVPSVLYGSYKSNAEEGIKAMLFAIDKAGYKGIDTALKYGNHDEVRQVLEQMKAPRESICLQTKLWPTEMREPEKYIDVAIKELGTYIDFLFIHWPIPLKGERIVDEDWDFMQTWKILEKIPKDKVKAIAVSNFRLKDLKKLLAECDVRPAVNQCEFHPELPQQDVVDFCLKNDIRPQAYRPLARGQVNDPILQQIAKKHNADPGQVALSWNVQRGVSVLPKSVTESRIISNNTLIDLDEEDLNQIAELGKRKNRTCGSSNIYGYEIFDEE